MDDECDFDELTALLENSDDEMESKASDEKTNTCGETATVPHLEQGAESSDDDIDESELDHLAGLLEAEATSDDTPSQVESTEEMQKGQEREMPVKIKMEKEEVKDKSRSEDGDAEDAEDSDDDESDAEDAEDTQEKLRLMQEQIMQLQAKLSKKKGKSPKGSSKTKPSGSPPNKHSGEKVSKAQTTSHKDSGSPAHKNMSSAHKQKSKTNEKDLAHKPKTEKSERHYLKEAKSVLDQVLDHDHSGRHEAHKRSSTGGKSQTERRDTHDNSNKISKESMSRRESGGSVLNKQASPVVKKERNCFDAVKDQTSASSSSGNVQVSSSSRLKGETPAIKPVEQDMSDNEAIDFLVAMEKSAKLRHKSKPTSVGGSSQHSPRDGDSQKTGSGSSSSRTVQEEALGLKLSDDDDSDWEGLDGEKNKELTVAGQQLKKLMARGDKQRVAHVPKSDSPKPDMSQLQNRKPTWKSGTEKFKERFGSSSSPSPSPSRPVPPVSADDSKDSFYGIRVSKPVVSSSSLKSRMQNRKMIKISRLHTRVNTSDMENDWVTFGVIVNKSEPKMSSKGSQYSIWTLSDLEDCDRPIKCFLFGNVFKTLWKTCVGSVVGILNPTIMQNSEKYQNSSEVTVTMDNPQQMLMLGHSRDFGTCKAKTKAGKDCTQFINKSQGEFCGFHVQNMYKKLSAKRAELQTSHTGVAPRSFEKKLQGSANKGCFMYGGQSFSLGAPTVQKKKATLSSLQKHQKSGAGVSGYVRNTTLSLHQLLPEDKARLDKLEKEKLQEQNKAFHDMLSTPSVGSMNLVKHMVKKEHSDKGQVVESGSQGKPTKIMSVSASQLLKQVNRDIGRTISAAKSRSKSHSLLSGAEGSGMDDLFLSGEKVKPLFENKGNIDISKIKAMRMAKAKGGFNREDPNAIKKLRSPESQDKIKKRLAEAENVEDADDNESGPPKKRSRLLGGVDLDDPEIQKLMQKRSKHDGQLTDKEQERFDEYFNIREKTERMEEKMLSIQEIKCKAVTCRQCKYTHYSALDSCKKEGHKLVWHDAVKRFFKCKECKKRVVTMDRYPPGSCKQCGGRTFVKTAMKEEKKVKEEQLLTRGVEEKYLNSLK